jgi:CRISPR system Cascade subunit CasE
MYLTKMVFNERSREAARDLSNIYELHRTLLHCLPDGEPGRLLYRIESENVALIQTELEPSWSMLPSGYAEAQMKCYRPALSLGATMRFRICASPMIRHRGQQMRIEEDRWVPWLTERLRGAGAATIDAGVTRSELASVNVRCNHSFLSRVTFDGVLTVADADLLLRALESGIGRNKAWGCGLLSLA